MTSALPLPAPLCDWLPPVLPLWRAEALALLLPLLLATLMIVGTCVAGARPVRVVLPQPEPLPLPVPRCDGAPELLLDMVPMPLCEALGLPLTRALTEGEAVSLPPPARLRRADAVRLPAPPLLLVSVGPPLGAEDSEASKLITTPLNVAPLLTLLAAELETEGLRETREEAEAQPVLLLLGAPPLRLAGPLLGVLVGRGGPLELPRGDKVELSLGCAEALDEGEALEHSLLATVPVTAARLGVPRLLPEELPEGLAQTVSLRVADVQPLLLIEKLPRPDMLVTSFADAAVLLLRVAPPAVPLRTLEALLEPEDVGAKGAVARPLAEGVPADVREPEPLVEAQALALLLRQAPPLALAQAESVGLQLENRDAEEQRLGDTEGAALLEALAHLLLLLETEAEGGALIVSWPRPPLWEGLGPMVPLPLVVPAPRAVGGAVPVADAVPPPPPLALMLTIPPLPLTDTLPESEVETCADEETLNDATTSENDALLLPLIKPTLALPDPQPLPSVEMVGAMRALTLGVDAALLLLLMRADLLALAHGVLLPVPRTVGDGGALAHSGPLLLGYPVLLMLRAAEREMEGLAAAVALSSDEILCETMPLLVRVGTAERVTEELALRIAVMDAAAVAVDVAPTLALGRDDRLLLAASDPL